MNTFTAAAATAVEVAFHTDTTQHQKTIYLKTSLSPPLMSHDTVTEHEHGEDYREEPLGRAYRRTN